jgi:putative hydrolase of the HAD superfamily
MLLSDGENYRRCALFDWGDTLMRDFPEFTGSMVRWPRIEVSAYAEDALAALRAKGWLLALATNAADSAESDVWGALQRAGLASLLDRVYCFRNVGCRKPSRAFFDFIVQDLDLPRSAIVMVGDDFAVDVLGANAAGIRGVWVAGERVPERTGDMHRTISDLRELAGLLEQWTSTGTDRTSAST